VEISDEKQVQMNKVYSKVKFN